MSYARLGKVPTDCEAWILVDALHLDRPVLWPRRQFMRGGRAGEH